MAESINIAKKAAEWEPIFQKQQAIAPLI